MKRYFLFLLRVFLLFLLYFVLWKAAFMIFNVSAHRTAGLTDYFAVVFHGLPLDIATSCYLLAPIVLLMMVHIWRRVPFIYYILEGYYVLVAVLSTLICAADTCLYSFWDFKIDATIFNYLSTFGSVTNSISGAYLTAGLAAWVLVSILFFLVLRTATPTDFRFPPRARRIPVTLLSLLLCALMFLGIRGGIGRSTANVGMVYFSPNQFLNHSAVNPVFSLFSSMAKSRNYSRMGRFYSAARADSLYQSLLISPESVDTDSLLTTRRPNVLIVILESFAGTFVGAMGNPAGITPQFDALTREGVFFTQFYSTSYRTDRGVLSILSGYPAFPEASLMKMPIASRHLPSIAASLRRAGYTNSFLYGGDINFTNMQSYLRSTGYTDIVGDTHFTPEQRLTHGWGVTDSITFDYLYSSLRRRPAAGGRWQTTFLTLASHEPWGVPYDRFPNDEKANAIAYVDHCLGKFIARMKRTPQWKNLLIVFLPDHGIGYPDGLTEDNPRRYHIPMLWVGGAVRGPRTVDRICGQNDLAATLLGQMDIAHREFAFSRDVLSATYRYPFAYHTFDNGMAFVDSTGATVYDITSGRVLTDRPTPSARRLSLGKAIVQKNYDELSRLEQQR